MTHDTLMHLLPLVFLMLQRYALLTESEQVERQSMQLGRKRAYIHYQIHTAKKCINQINIALSLCFSPH